MSFADQAKRLLDKERFEELMDMCRKHIDEYPGDAHGYWFQGQADFRRGNLRHALVSLRKVEQLQPDWDANTRPLIDVIERRLSQPGENHDFKVISPNNPPMPDTPPSGGSPVK
jgi:hypothetical protein